MENISIPFTHFSISLKKIKSYSIFSLFEKVQSIKFAFHQDIPIKCLTNIYVFIYVYYICYYSCQNRECIFSCVATRLNEFFCIYV